MGETDVKIFPNISWDSQYPRDTFKIMYGSQLCPHSYIVRTMDKNSLYVIPRAQNKVQSVLGIWGIFTNLWGE